ncbi:MAG: sugar phosphate isomerase/epimerase family protein [Alphaproteobacteria bacterium]
MSALPILGCAMELHNLEKMAPWILEKNRDLEIQDGYHAFVLDKTADKVADRVKELLGTSYTGRLGLHGPFYGFDLDSIDPAIRKVVKMRLEQALRMAHRMGATQMVLHSPLTLWDRDNMLHMGYEAGKIALVEDTLSDAIKMAEDFGVTIVLENIQDIDPTWRVRLIEALGSERIRTSIDTGHAHYMHGRFGAPHVVDYIKSAGDMLEHVHLQDTDGSADRHWGIGEGQLPWFPIFEALGKLNSNPRLIMEPMDVPAAPRHAAWAEAQGLAR